MNLLWLAGKFHRVVIWLGNHHIKHHLYVSKSEHVHADIRRIMSPWPDELMSYNAIYCRSSMGNSLKIGLKEMVEKGLVRDHGVSMNNGEHSYSWIKS